jgi:hypothetical protein
LTVIVIRSLFTFVSTRSEGLFYSLVNCLNGPIDINLVHTLGK